jgi:hypothetical protein
MPAVFPPFYSHINIVLNLIDLPQRSALRPI